MCTYVYVCMNGGYVYMHEWAGLGFNRVIEVCFVLFVGRMGVVKGLDIAFEKWLRRWDIFSGDE